MIFVGSASGARYERISCPSCPYECVNCGLSLSQGYTARWDDALFGSMKGSPAEILTLADITLTRIRTLDSV